MTFEYDSVSQGGDLDTQSADTPEEAITKTFSSPWNLERITYDKNKPCHHFRMKDAHVTVYVCEHEEACSECGSDDPFEPEIVGCKTCCKEVKSVIEDAERYAGRRYAGRLPVYRVTKDEPIGICIGFRPDLVKCDAFYLDEDNGGEFVHITNGCLVHVDRIPEGAEPDLLIWRTFDEFNVWAKENS